MIRPKPVKPGPGQESAWDYPRPPRLPPVLRHLLPAAPHPHRSTSVDRRKPWSGRYDCPGVAERRPGQGWCAPRAHGSWLFRASRRPGQCLLPQLEFERNPTHRGTAFSLRNPARRRHSLDGHLAAAAGSRPGRRAAGVGDPGSWVRQRAVLASVAPGRTSRRCYDIPNGNGSSSHRGNSCAGRTLRNCRDHRHRPGVRGPSRRAAVAIPRRAYA